MRKMGDTGTTPDGSGNDGAFFKTLVEQQYAENNVHLHSLSQYEFDWRGIYRVEFARGESGVLRAVRQDEGISWLLKPAATLLFLEQQGYPAPRMVRTRSGELVGKQHDWWTFMVTFIEGDPLDYAPETLRELAEVAARLHNLNPDAASAAVPPVQASWKHPQEAIPECLGQLDQINDRIPPELQTFCDEVRATLERFQQATHLPMTVTHGDCWSGNAVRTHDNAIVLIDWDGSGFDLPIIDLGTLLLTCHFNQPPLSRIKPDRAAIPAIMEGYCKERTLAPSELDMLEDAVRFNSAFHFASDAQSLLQEGWQGNSGLLKLRLRFEGAQEIAEVARKAAGQG